MIIGLDEVRQHLRIDHGDEDGLLMDKIEAAQDHLERILGYAVADVFGGEGQEPVPASLKEAVLQLVATWFDGSRGLVAVENSLAEMPISFQEIVREYREWSF